MYVEFFVRCTLCRSWNEKEIESHKIAKRLGRQYHKVLTSRLLDPRFKSSDKFLKMLSEQQQLTSSFTWSHTLWHSQPKVVTKIEISTIILHSVPTIFQPRHFGKKAGVSN